ncbi:hypothetical protein [Rubrobacter marinus]|uniref:hypothetical protein n=1 Tax=Rubrobacter marinus TaxID=2653852 RepID=UPI001A9F1A15|nr:hypothetical protein [Rubrobacter marinus]
MEEDHHGEALLSGRAGGVYTRTGISPPGPETLRSSTFSTGRGSPESPASPL